MNDQSDDAEMTSDEPPPRADREVARRTYRWDLLRGGMQGIVEACIYTFGLLIAIRVFDAPDLLKALLPGSYSLGLLLSPVALMIGSRLGGTAGRMCAFCSLVSGLAMLGVIAARELSGYLFYIVLYAIFLAQTVSLLTKIYATNYSVDERGSKYSTAVFLSGVVSAAFAYIGGIILDIDIGLYRWLFLIAALALFVNVFAYCRMPAVRIFRVQHGKWGSDFKLALRDRVFVLILIAWMFQGFGQVMTLPIRIEYLANERYGINATNEQISVVMGVVPFVTYILATKVWGFVFDRWNFVTLRITSNLIAVVSIFTVFFTSSLWIIGFGMAMYGVSLAGGRILWQLWVVQIAPSDQVSSYMGVHVAFTGVRGTLAPFVAYLLVGLSDPRFVGWTAIALIIIGICLMLPHRKRFGPVLTRVPRR